MQKFSITNRDKQHIVVGVDIGKKGLAFIMHGLGSNREEPQIKTFANAFIEEGITAVRFDATNSFGESGGLYENATVTNYYQDLEDVINWAKQQTWYAEPFYLIGHSMGGMCVTLYAQQHPDIVKGLAPISTLISGKLSLEAHPKEELDTWNATGWRISEKSGKVKKLNWHTHISDRLKYDILLHTDKLTMPVLLVVGDDDISTPVHHQEMLFNRLTSPTELHIISGATHAFKNPEHLASIQHILRHWIRDIEHIH